MITLNREAVLVPIGKDGDAVVNATVKELTKDGEVALLEIVDNNSDLSFIDAYYQGKFDAVIDDCVELPSDITQGMLPGSIRKEIFAKWKEVGSNSDFFQMVETKMTASVLDSMDLGGISNLLKNGAFSSPNEDTAIQGNTEESDL